jgi:hypothetical protein
MAAETTRASAATPMQAIKILKATINPQRGLRLSIALRKFSRGSGSGPVLTEYAIDLILPRSLNQPGASLVPPRTLLPPDTFSFFGAMSAYAMLRFCSLSFVVLRKSRVWLNLAELLLDCDQKVATTQENPPHARLRTGWRCGLRFCSLFTI